MIAESVQAVAGQLGRFVLGRRIWGAHPFVWVVGCVLVALCAVVLATTVLGDPHGANRRAFLRECHDQALDTGGIDQCFRLARQRFGSFDSAKQNAAYVVAAVALFAGTVFVVLYVVRQVAETADSPG
jgi:hypothetical protein